MTKQLLQKETDRYLKNGKELLKKAEKRGKFYTDEKYIKLAGHAFYSGVLIALDEIMPKKAKNEKEYRAFLANKNKTVLKHFKNAYDILHRSMGYDGILNYIVIREGIKSAETVITWVLKQK